MSDTAILDPVASEASWDDQVAAISEALHEPAWLRELRLEALERARTLPWPSSREEAWRRTPEERLPREFAAAELGASTRSAALTGFLSEERAGLLEHQDVSTTAAELSEAARADGVLLLPLAQAAREHEALVRPNLYATLPPDYDRYTALAGALWTQGLFCYVPRGVRVEGALLHLISKSASARSLFSHSLIVAEPLAEVSLIEAAASDAGGERSLVLHNLELIAREGAQLQVGAIQRWADDVSVLGTCRGRVERDANLQYVTASFGADLDKQRIEVDLVEPGANADLRGVFVGHGAQHFEHITRQNHNGPGGTSDLLIRGALGDTARAVQYGVIRIQPEGQKTAAHQTMRNLLLSSGAGADPIPVLEIEADDVACSHAAAVGPVDREHLFYLQSRGIPEPEAERMVVRGFLSEVVDEIPNAHVRSVVDTLVDEALASVAINTTTNNGADGAQ